MRKKIQIPPEQKLAAVKEYLSGQISLETCAPKYGVSDMALRNWLRKYKLHGASGLQPAVQSRQYSIEIKQAAVEEYLSGNKSLSKMCEKYDISDASLLRGWIKRYNSHGDFSQPKTRKADHMAKGRKTTPDERIEIVHYCIANNKDYGRTIKLYGVSYGQIYSWVKKYEQDGIDGLIDRRGKRKDESAMSENEKLRAQLKVKEAENLLLQMENDLLKKLETLERGRGRG